MEKIIKKTQFVTLPADTDPDKIKWEAAQELRNSGMTAKQVAQVLNIPVYSVNYHTIPALELRGANMRKGYEERFAYYEPIMRKLRKLGYNNTEIAQKTGFHPVTVHKYIGTQPDEITLASLRIAGAKRRLRNQAVRNQAARDDGDPIPAVANVLKTA